MAKQSLNVTAKAEKVDGAKAKAQKTAADAIEKKKREADKTAEEAAAEEKRIAAEKEAARKKAEAEKEAARKAAEEAAEAEKKAREEAEEAARKEKEEREKKITQATAAGAAIAAAAYQSAKKEGIAARIPKGFVAGLLVGAAAGLLIGFLFFRQTKTEPEPYLASSIAETVAPVEEADVTIDNDGVLGYTAADFQDAVLGGASEHQELIVFEQELSIPTTLTKSGLGNFAVFSKMKNITYYGTGVYTVDMSRIDEAHIRVDEENRIVTVLIPHTALQYVNAELEKTEFEETDKGLLSFGDIKLTAEETNMLETAVVSAMRERLDSADMYEEADRFATLKTWEIFQPLVTAVSPAYKVEVQFEEREEN